MDPSIASSTPVQPATTPVISTPPKESHVLFYVVYFFIGLILGLLLMWVYLKVIAVPVNVLQAAPLPIVTPPPATPTPLGTP